MSKLKQIQLFPKYEQKKICEDILSKIDHSRWMNYKSIMCYEPKDSNISANIGKLITSIEERFVTKVTSIELLLIQDRESFSKKEDRRFIDFDEKHIFMMFLGKGTKIKIKSMIQEKYKLLDVKQGDLLYSSRKIQRECLYQFPSNNGDGQTIILVFRAVQPFSDKEPKTIHVTIEDGDPYLFTVNTVGKRKLSKNFVLPEIEEYDDTGVSPVIFDIIPV